MQKGKLKIINQKDGAGGDCCSSTNKSEIAGLNIVKPEQFLGKAAVITLGCAKNQVDSELILGFLQNYGYELTTDLGSAEIIVVNTCGFLESSTRESIDAILAAAKYKKTGRLKKLVVAGCLVERYRDQLKESLPEVDTFVLVDDLKDITKIIENNGQSLLTNSARPYFLYDDTMPRYLAEAKHYAYLKISDGCDRPCTFCIIPQLRGAMRSRQYDSVLREVDALLAQGVKEFNLVAQDLTDYGRDLKDGKRIVDLLYGIADQAKGAWIRLLYTYPLGISPELVELVTSRPEICEYIDVPLQHSSESVLRNMKRPLGKYSPRSLAQRIKEQSPSIHLRTTFIVGFPGETEADVEDLANFIRDGYFTNLGIFTFSPEHGTPAADMTEQVPDKEKKARRDYLMKIQQGMVKKQMKEFLGKELEVIVDGFHEESELLFVGRTRFQAPEVDGSVIINDIGEFDPQQIAKGAIRKVRISEVKGYDLIGEVVG